MGSYSVGEAINQLIERSHWKPKIIALRMSEEWEAITGKAIAKYTRSLNMEGKTLIIYTDVAPLKQELQYGKENLIARINEYFKEQVIDNIIVR
jgi:predicted nucleic acid-binding Zn ribbon protein